MLEPLGFWSLITLYTLLAAAIDDLKRLEIHPLYYKTAFASVVLGSIVEGNTISVIVSSLVWYAAGILLWKLKAIGGGDAKLLLPAGAYIAYMGVASYTYGLFLIFTAYGYVLISAIILLMQRRPLNVSVAFAPVYLIALVLCLIFLKSVGF